jgi:hypothetical protein
VERIAAKSVTGGALAPGLQPRTGVEWWMWLLGAVIVVGALWIIAGAIGFRRNLRGDE